MEDGIASVAEQIEGMPYVERTEGAPEFDGNLTGKTFVEIEPGFIFAVKMSDKALSTEELIGQTLTVDGDDSMHFVITNDMLQESVIDDNNKLITVSIYNTALVYSVRGDVSALGYSLTDGVYFIYMSMDGQTLYTKRLTGFTAVETIHKLNPKCLPDGSPFVEEAALVPEFDGDPSNWETDDWGGPNTGITFVKMSDAPLTKEEILGAKLSMFMNGATAEMIVTEDMLDEYEDNGNAVLEIYDSSIIIVTGDNENNLCPVGKGVWFMYMNATAGEYAGNHAYPISLKTQTIHPLDEKFLPESVDGVIIRSSTEGSTKKFKLTVDDAGTITAIEV